MKRSQQGIPQKKLKVALLIDSEITSKYVYDLAKWSQSQDNLEISHIIIQSIKPRTTTKMQKIIALVKQHGIACLLQQILFGIISKIEYIKLKKTKYHKDHFNAFNIKDIVKDSFSIMPIISKSGYVYRYSEDDIQRIQQLELDVLIRCGSGILRGNILNVARFGIISFHHADNRINRGGPAGFWEVFLKQASTGFTLQQLTEELDGGNILSRGHFPTQFFYLLNQATLYTKANYYLKKLLAEIAATRTLPGSLHSSPYFNPLYKTPSLIIQLQYLVALGSLLFIDKFQRFIMRTSHRWGVAFTSNNWKNIVMWRSIRIPNPPHQYLADPFVISSQNENYCFVEDYDYATAKGAISVYKLNEKIAERLGHAIVEPFHMSFPYIFEYKSQYYLCPETSANKDIRLYECTRFPLEWKLKKVIMSNVSAVDSMIFKKDDLWWLFTNIDPVGIGEHCSELFIYYADNPLSDHWTPHPKNPIFVDSMKARNGGILFDEKCVYRVSQQQGFNMYGKCSVINKIICLSKVDYQETKVVKIEPNFFHNLKGTHHMHSNDQYTVFDFVKRSKSNF